MNRRTGWYGTTLLFWRVVNGDDGTNMCTCFDGRESASNGFSGHSFFSTISAACGISRSITNTLRQGITVTIPSSYCPTTGAGRECGDCGPQMYNDDRYYDYRYPKC